MLIDHGRQTQRNIIDAICAVEHARDRLDRVFILNDRLDDVFHNARDGEIRSPLETNDLRAAEDIGDDSEALRLRQKLNELIKETPRAKK